MNKYLLRTKFKNEIISEFLPPSRPSNKVIIFCSGMPGYPSRYRYTELCNYYSKKGYWCFVPRYRGAWESGGKLFAKSPHLDILDVINALPQGFKEYWDGNKYKIDKPEVYLVGSSFGGTAVLLCSFHKWVKKVISFSPVLDWRKEDKTEEPISKLRIFMKEGFGMAYRVAIGGWERIKKGKIYNPVTEVDKIDGRKCLMFNAKNDKIISTRPINKFVKKTGVRSILYPTGGHLGVYILKPKYHKICQKFLKSK